MLRNESTKVVVWDRNGRVWHLAGAGAGREGVRLLRQQAYMFAPVSLLVSEGARQDGATFLRSVRSKKELDFHVLLDGKGSVRGMHAIHDAWHRGWATDQTCTWGWYTRHQGWRFQKLQLDAAPEPLGDYDPALNSAVEYQMSVVAMDPLVSHFDEPQVWVNSDGLGEGVVRARNAADQLAWPRYTMNGPGRFHIGDLGGGDEPRIVQTPPILTGETLRIDTHPRHRTARVYSDANPSGRNVFGALAGRRWFEAIPPWTAVDIPVRVTDGGTLASTVRIDLTPRSSRPF